MTQHVQSDTDPLLHTLGGPRDTNLVLLPRPILRQDVAAVPMRDNPRKGVVDS